jgi:alpha-ribazole phosphatase/probable phosphoglycerate mutase
LRILRRLGLKHQGDRVLVFTHAGVVNQVLGCVVGQTAARWGIYRPGNASITELRFDGEKFEVVRFDDRDHLSSAIARQPF